jgi:integrase
MKDFSIFKAIQSDLSISPQMRVALSILESYNCRASEVLSARWDDFFPGKFLFLRGKKKSDDIVVRDRTILFDIRYIERSTSPLIFYLLSYNKLYREVKSKYSHLFIKFKGKHNYKVTHGFRYLNAQFSNDERRVKVILHHASLRSGKFYNKNLATNK